VTSGWPTTRPLRAALDDGAVLPLFVLDPVLLRGGGGPGLSVLGGQPWTVVPRVAAEIGADRVHVAADFGPYRRRRDTKVAEALGEHRELVRSGSPYAVAPGTLTTKAGDPFQVFSPFHRAWLDHGVHDPAPGIRACSTVWLAATDPADLPEADEELVGLAGERTAREQWRAWRRRDAEGSPATRRCTTSPVRTPRHTCRSRCAGVICIPVRC
jgi:deoxyribodipyrimidine photo-lyase